MKSVSNQVNNKVLHQLLGQVYDHVNADVWGKLWDTILINADNSLLDQVGDRVWEHIFCQDEVNKL